MRLAKVEHRYRFEFEPGEVTVESVTGRAFELATAEVIVTPIDGGVEFIETRFRGFALAGIVGRNRQPMTRPVETADTDVERQLVARVREIRGTS